MNVGLVTLPPSHETCIVVLVILVVLVLDPIHGPIRDSGYFEDSHGPSFFKRCKGATSCAGLVCYFATDHCTAHQLPLL